MGFSYPHMNLTPRLAFLLDDIGRLFSQSIRCHLKIGCDGQWEDGCICDTEVLYTFHTEVRIDNLAH